MKKVLLVISLALILTACGTVSTSANKKAKFNVYDEELTISTDTETGCKYILFEKGGITPLMLNDGTQDCRRDFKLLK